MNLAENFHGQKEVEFKMRHPAGNRPAFQSRNKTLPRGEDGVCQTSASMNPSRVSGFWIPHGNLISTLM
jgi:hypothetical protein